MRYSNANSFKAKIKNIAKVKGVPPQQVQQNYLIEQILRKIASSDYKDSFIVKGGYLISNIIGIDKRTTMDLDVTLKGMALSEDKIRAIFDEVFKSSDGDGFYFEIDALQSIRRDDIYGGFELKIKAQFDTLREVVFIDVTTGDKITPREIEFSIQSIFSEDDIKIFSYNLETVLAEKLEAIISRGEGSTRPRDRYDMFTIWKLQKETVDLITLREALVNTVTKRGTMVELKNWQEQLASIYQSDYQRQLWRNYQRTFKYATEISFEASVDVVAAVLKELKQTDLASPNTTKA
ncbi:MAG: nucleotidyl transferase AbiEii/AbiGii toxin family protein [Streptococcaceae bacterium]|nr:nucleotidyl transferase AbiEii/AbiGii toxin family protein [Streptococcaceae bacterium]